MAKARKHNRTSELFDFPDRVKVGLLHETEQPDTDQFANPVADPVMVDYLKLIEQWHGYVRFLGLPHLADNPDVPIDRLFVEPDLTNSLVLPAAFDNNTIRESMRDVLQKNRSMVLLGDPGSGKSTLLNFLAWELSRRNVSSWSTWMFFGSSDKPRPLPIPFVLRELLTGSTSNGHLSWDRLFDLFSGLPMFQAQGADEKTRLQTLARKFRSQLEPFLKRGQAYFLIDGIDEIGSVDVRRQLRSAVWEGMDRYPKCGWLMTSRVLGYDEVPFDKLDDETSNESFELDMIEGSLARNVVERRLTRRQITRKFFVSPFSDEKIAQFAKNWFTQRDVIAERGNATADNLIAALSKKEDTQVLARIPNLLTLIALIYRVQLQLPDGRARLYNMITEAYLKSIDSVRSIRTIRFDWEDIKTWLAYVGFKMQVRRRDAEVENKIDDKLLVNRETVSRWFEEAMQASEIEPSNEQIDELIDFLGRRSGLLIPRGVDSEGHDCFAFLHLSFQEYMAAVHIHVQLEDDANWFNDEESDAAGLEPPELAEKAYWHEVIVFLFELNERLRKKTVRLYRKFFPNADSIDYGDSLRLMGRLAIDQHVKLSDAICSRILEKIVSTELKLESHRTLSSIMGDLISLGSSKYLSQLSELVCASIKESKQSRFSLANSNLKSLPDEFWTIQLTKKVTSLYLHNTGVSELGPLAGLTGLQTLWLSNTGVSELGPLAGLTGLQMLSLDNTGVSELGPLAGLTGLQMLSLSNTGVSELGPLAGLTGLQTLSLHNTGVSELGPLAGLTGLQTLYLHNTGVSELGPLAGLTGLQTLYLHNTGVSELGPLAGLTGLQTLYLHNTGVSELGPLAGLTGLQTLSLSNTGVSELGPLAGLTGLQTLSLDNTGVSELGPLAGLTGLQTLSLDNTGVSELGPLAGLTGLQTLSLNNTGVSELGPLAGLTGLQTLWLHNTGVSELKPIKKLIDHGLKVVGFSDNAS